jgi:glycosyltransferase involved in cell wall biosynthesis
MSIALTMMVKNEHKQIAVTLTTVVGIVNDVIIYDTGSTDNTIDIIEEFCLKNNIRLHLKRGTFVDFSTSRNVLLDFADTIDVDFLLLMDCNDQLQNGKELLKFVNSPKIADTSILAWHVTQTWFCGSLTTYRNVRFIRNRSNMRYVGVVHEYICKDNYSVEHELPPEIVIFQDRTKDDDKTKYRFNRDLELLIRENKKHPKEPRTLFYLAQTYECVGKPDSALKYYIERYNEPSGFWEERYEAIYRCCLILNKKRINNECKWEEVLSLCMKSLEVMMRAEPLVLLAEYYQEIKQFEIAYLFLERACNLEYPKHCALFIDKNIYEYKRFHLLGIIAFYVKQYKKGYEACLHAYRVAGLDVDRDNLMFYLKNENLTQTL